MKKYTSILLLLVITLIACRQDEAIVVGEEERILPETEIVFEFDIEGKVVDKFGFAIDDATVEIYSQSNLITSLKTDETGYFLFEELEVPDKFRLYINKENFISNLDFLSSEELEEVTLEYELLSQPDDPNLVIDPIDPTRTDIVFIEGRVIDDNDKGIETTISGEQFLEDWYSYTFSDEEGYFSLPCIVGSELVLKADNGCSTEILRSVLVEHDSLLLSDIQVEVPEVSIIEGLAVDCEGGLYTGQVELFSYTDNEKLTEIIQIDNGFFQVEVSDCEDLLLGYFFVVNVDTGEEGFGYLFSEEEDLIFEVVFCEGIVFEEGYFNVKLEGKDSLNLGYHEAFINGWGKVEVFSFFTEGVQMSFRNPQLGVNYVRDFVLFLEQEVYFSCPEVKVEFTNIAFFEGEFFEGTIEGELIQVDSQKTRFTGNFKIPLVE